MAAPIVSGPTTLAVTDGSAAPAGTVGEYIESVVSTAQNFPTASQFGDLTSIALTAGDWDINVQAQYQLHSATVNEVFLYVSAYAGNNNPDGVSGDNAVFGLAPSSANETQLTIVSLRRNISTPTTYYMKTYGSQSVGTPQWYGKISARRRR